MRKTIAFLIVWTVCLSAHAVWADATVQSPESRVSLLELYSSQGCSSCPPAEAWINRLTQDPGLWKSFVPVNFHVDYWDGLGWKDPFSSAEATERQGMYVQSWGERTLYTPGFVLNGLAWNGWSQSGTVPAFPTNPGVLKADISAAGRVRVSFAPRESVPADFFAHAALLGFSLETEVKKGENAGRVLKHDFTVLELNSAPMTGAPLLAEVDLSPAKHPGVKLGLAVWVTKAGALRPVQAAGGYLEQT